MDNIKQNIINYLNRESHGIHAHELYIDAMAEELMSIMEGDLEFDESGEVICY